MATIRQRSSGKWQAIIRRKGHAPVVKSFLNRIDAEKWARGAESKMDRGSFLDRTEAERTTIGQLIDRYLGEVTPAKRSASREERYLKGLKARPAVSLLLLYKHGMWPHIGTNG